MICNRIKVLRAERNWTQEDLANKVGISRQAVISIEKYKLRHLWNWLLGLQKHSKFLGRLRMNDQIFILILLILTVIATMWLYLLKAKK